MKNPQLLRQLFTNRLRGPEAIKSVFKETQKKRPLSAREQRLALRRQGGRRKRQQAEDAAHDKDNHHQIHHHHHHNQNYSHHHHHYNVTTEQIKAEKHAIKLIREHERNFLAEVSVSQLRPPMYPTPMSFRGIFRHKQPKSKRRHTNKDEITLSEILESYIENPQIPLAQQLIRWSRQNWSLLLFNAGSICTLVAFTRSDALELRSLSMAGSICTAIFRFAQSPFLWLPFAWPTVFASVNAIKIYSIFDERKGVVYMTPVQQDIYNTHFLPHGVTPRQFSRLFEAATKLEVLRDMPILSQGDPMDKVFLVVEGSTRAHILGRHLTAISSNPKANSNDDDLQHSGVWIGEMTFLDRMWEREYGNKIKITTDKDSQDEKTDVQQLEKSPDTSLSQESFGTQGPPSNTQTRTNSKAMVVPPCEAKKTLDSSLYTVVAKEDCNVWCWTHEELAEIMTISADMRGALTRAMTAAIVAKVVRMTVNQPSSAWSRWLSDWTRQDGAQVQVEQLPEEKIQPQEDVDDDKFPEYL